MYILIVILFLIALALFLNALYKRTNSYQNQFLDVRKFAVKGCVGDNLQIVNLGSNHPKFGLDYTGLDVKGENWAVGPETFEYDFAVLRKNVSHLAYGAVVVIPVCLLSFFLYRQRNRSIHVKYYSFLPPEDIIGYSKFEKLTRYDYPLLFHPKALLALIRDTKKDERLLLDSNTCKTEDALNKDSDFWIDSWNKDFDIKLPSPILSIENKKNILKNIQILKEMIEYCLSKNLQPVITILPITSCLYSRFTTDFVEKHILSYIKDANNSNAPVINYLTDERFTNPDLYINTFFFNTKGRVKFTKQLIKDLRAQNIL